MDMITMGESLIKTQAFKLKGRLYTFTVLQVLDTDKELFGQQCKDMTAKAPKLFINTPIVLDISAVCGRSFDLVPLLHIISEHGMMPVAIQGGSPVHTAVALAHHLAVLNGSDSHDKTVIESTNDTNSEVIKSKLVTTPVRSGQQIVAKNTDLIVTSSVSHGAELLADGSIHIYGTLRGRALAGLSGDLEARIFCQSLEAELVAIAGFYSLSDTIKPVNGPCQIFLKDERIIIEPL
jgi:septum site-determining protein MinC